MQISTRRYSPFYAFLIVDGDYDASYIVVPAGALRGFFMENPIIIRELGGFVTRLAAKEAGAAAVRVF